MTSIRDLNDLYFFAQVADFGSYEAAAPSLGIDLHGQTLADVI